MKDATSSGRPRAWRLQFSLKLLLVAFTAFAIGFPIWYRWPYEETHTNPGTGDERVTTWQRQWGGGRLKHGVERRSAGATQMIVNSSDQIVSSFAFDVVELTTYRDGRKQGLYEHRARQGELTGQYADDLKDGVWVSKNKSMVTRTESWSYGKLDGPAEIRLAPTRSKKKKSKAADANSVPSADKPRVVKLKFVQGRLTEYDGKPAVNRLFDRLESGEVDDIASAELRKDTTIDVVEMPLKDCMLYLADMFSLPIMLDPKAIPQSGLPITNELRGIDLCSALLLLTAPNGLASDYRYGCIWITTAEDGNDWLDPTGVSEIKPPKDSALGRAWTEISPPVDTVQTPLSEILAYLKQPLAIEIDTSQIDEVSADFSPPLVTLSLRGVRFCDTLGQLLYRSGCRCRLEGDKLVILPAD